MKAKDIYLIIIGIITAICVIFGCLINIVFPSIYLFSIDNEKGVIRDDEVVVSENYSDLDIDASALSIKLVVGDENGFKYTGPEKYAPKIVVNNGKASVTQKGIKVTNNKSIDELLLTITIKNENKNLSDLNVDLDFGEINIDGISAHNLDISADCGSVKVVNGAFSNTNVEADLGEVEFKDATFDNNLNIEADCGSINIINPGDWTNANIEATTDLGNVNIDIAGIKHSGKSYEREGEGIDVNLHADLGEIKIEKQ